MSIYTEWYDDEHRALVQRFEGTWDWGDLAVSIKIVEERTLNHPAPVLVDLTNTSFLPAGNVMLHGKNQLIKMPDSITHMIFVVDSPLIKTFASMVFGMLPMWRNRTRFVKTIDEGRNIINRLIMHQIQVPLSS